MKKAVSLLTLLSLLVSVIGLSSCSSFGVWINEWHFPDPGLRRAVRSYSDKDKDGYLSKKEMEESKTLIVWDQCSDLSGIEHLTNLETLALVNCSELSGVEKLTNLKEVSFSNQCPDLSAFENLTNIEEIFIECCVFSETFVFDNKVPVTNFKFRDCVFENGVLFKNDSVEYIEFGYCGNGECEGSGDFVFADCEKLFWLRAEFDSEQERKFSVDLSGCDNLDWFLISSEGEQLVTSVDLSNCSTLRSFAISDRNNVDDTEITINISGSPNIEEVSLPEGIKEIDISDCPHLISASEQTPYEERFRGFIYESEDGYILTGNEHLVFIK